MKIKVLCVVTLSTWLLIPHSLTNHITIKLRVEGLCNYY